MTVKWPPTCIPMHFSASRSLTQPLLDCILYRTQIRYPYDPGALAGCATRCILGKVYLRSNLSSKRSQPRVDSQCGQLAMTHQLLAEEELTLLACRNVRPRAISSMRRPPLRDHRSSFLVSLLTARIRSPPWHGSSKVSASSAADAMQYAAPVL